MNDEHEGVDARLLGRCPECETDISPDRLLAKYEADGSWPRLLAECPTCTDIVSPV